MKNSMRNYRYRWYIVFCVVLCDMFLSACGQHTEKPQDKAEALPKLVEQTVAMPDLSGAQNVDEALALLIEDEGFRECVRYGTDITEEDSPEEVLHKLENCESIVLREAPYGNAIYSLKSLSLLPNLKQLVVDISEWDDSAITDFTPIEQLSELEELYINYGKDEQINLSFLGQMRTITGLFLTRCKIADVSFIGQMSKLRCLSLYETPVEDLAVLEKLPELVELSLSGNENAKNIEVVGTLTRMQDLRIQYCGIEDISFLSGLTQLRGLNLNGNSIADITPLAGLCKLERLGLAENRISNISVLENMSNLFDLALDGNQIQDISVLTKLSHLNQAGLSNNQIEDLSPLAGKEELMYVSVSGNPVKSMSPIWDVPMLLYAERGVSDEEGAFIADWLAEHYPEAVEFECIDFIRGDLNNDGQLDVAFVADSAGFDTYEDDYSHERRMFILLQQKDGTWTELEDVPYLGDSQSGGMRGDPYHGSFMESGYLLIKEGWGSSSGTEQSKVYEYRDGILNLVKTLSVDDYNYAEGYDVRIQDERTGTWRRYAIAMDGYRMVRVDLADSEHMEHKAFPQISIYDMSYHVYENQIETQMASSEALDKVLKTISGDEILAVQEKLPYAVWQKEGYELLLGVTVPDYYYVLPETQGKAEAESAEWAGDYLYYGGIMREDGRLCHVICLHQEEEKREILLDDVTGEIIER